MNVDNTSSSSTPTMSSLQPNAEAGPSTLSRPTSRPPPTPPVAPQYPLFLPPPVAPRHRAPFSATEELLTRFELLPVYDKYVRPHITPSQSSSAIAGQDHAPIAGPSSNAKGKEPEREKDEADAGSDDEGGAGEKKKKNTYRHLIGKIPGKHSLKKDTYLTDLMMAPPKDRVRITPFDQRTQREAFSVGLEGCKGFTLTALVPESPQARADRKRRKEAKRLARLGAQAGTPMSAPTNQPGPSTAAPTPGAIGPPPRTGSQTPRPRLPAITTAKGHSNSTPAPTPAALPTPTGDGAAASRGVKRELDESHAGNLPSGAVSQVTMNTKAGVPGARPRPVKKQRMDTAGQARDITIPVQQPTPQGV